MVRRGTWFCKTVSTCVPIQRVGCLDRTLLTCEDRLAYLTPLIRDEGTTPSSARERE